jgi:hypothetical protein
MILSIHLGKNISRNSTRIHNNSQGEFPQLDKEYLRQKQS